MCLNFSLDKNNKNSTFNSLPLTYLSIGPYCRAEMNIIFSWYTLRSCFLCYAILTCWLDIGFETHLGKFSKLEQPSPHLISVYILDELRCVGDAIKFPSFAFQENCIWHACGRDKESSCKACNDLFCKSIVDLAIGWYLRSPLLQY